jgi:L-malate glycosyltransferase
MSGERESPRLLHLHGSLATGDPLAERCLRVIAGLGRAPRHTMVSGDGTWSVLDRVPKGLAVQPAPGFPALGGPPTFGRLQRLAQAMVDYHLVLTYGRGGIVAALAHTMFAQLYSLPPLIHHEDGSDETPRQRRGLASTWYRRLGLGKSAGLVVPGEVMEREALMRWQQPIGRVKTIRDGVDLDRLARGEKPTAIPRLVKRPGECWIGCMDAAFTHESLVALLDGLVAAEPCWHLVIMGEGAGRDALEMAVSQRELENRVHLIGALPDAATLVLLSDLVAILPGRSSPLPEAALLAMGAGRAVVGVETGELASSLAPDNAPFIIAAGAEGGLAAALEQLAADPFLRQRVGEANRERAVAERDRKAMIAGYRRLYASAMGREIA